jgi:hypothetical protein
MDGQIFTERKPVKNWNEQKQRLIKDLSNTKGKLTKESKIISEKTIKLKDEV